MSVINAGVKDLKCETDLQPLCLSGAESVPIKIPLWGHLFFHSAAFQSSYIFKK